MSRNRSFAFVLSMLLFTGVWTSASAKPSALASALSAPFARLIKAGAKVAVHVVDLDTGQTVYARDENIPLNPASCVKLVTAAAALDLLGPDFRFVTKVQGKRPQGGVIQGDIYLVGSGDPGLALEDLWRLAHLVSSAGVTRVTGDVVVDESIFDGEHTPPFFDSKKSDHAYRAKVCGAAVAFGTLQVRISPGSKVGAPAIVVVDPPDAPVLLDNGAVTKAGKNRLMVSSVPVKGKDRVVVRGSIAPDSNMRTVLRRTEQPCLVSGHGFRAMLAREGIRIDGGVRLGTAEKDTVTLAKRQSEALAQQVARMNKWSNNFMAEMLLKVIGAFGHGRPGSAAGGVAYVGRYLKRAGVNPDAFRYGNGSGLYDSNRFSPRALTTVLSSIAAKPGLAQEFMASLATGGQLGTLSYRLKTKPAVGRVRAKTGTLNRAIGLSGYVHSVMGRRYAFAILINEVKGIHAARAAADKMVSELSAWSKPLSEPDLR